MSEYRTIKELVITSSMEAGSIPTYEKLTALVRQHFPTSKWQKTHYAWYKSKIKNGEIAVPGLQASEPDQDQADAAGDDVPDIEAIEEATLSLERDLHNYLATRLNQLEVGLILVDGGIEVQTEVGRIDLLARDAQRRLVVIELKAPKAKDGALGQLLGYVAAMSAKEPNVRGMLVASDFDPRVVVAASALPHIALVRYQLSFAFQAVGNARPAAAQ